VRSRQTELRLLKARQLLSDSTAKIIEVAFESGYRNLSLFNSLFKRRFGVTPSECRAKAKKNGALRCALGAAALLFMSGRDRPAGEAPVQGEES